MVKVLETTVIEIEGMLEGLREKHSSWEKHQRQSDTMLYALLEGSLEFYRLLKTDEDCLTAFKELVHFRWNKKTKLSTMVVKAIFGDKAKKGYAYAKALEAALIADIGKADKPSMTHWLNENGGINGVVRLNQQKSKTALQREHAIVVGRNPQNYGIKRKVYTFTSNYVTDIYKDKREEELVLLCKYDPATQVVHILWDSTDHKLVNEMYASCGDAIMQHQPYKNNRQRVHKQQAVKKAAATAKVKMSLGKIAAKVAAAEKVKKAA